jgi:hypothetical protein
LFSFLSYWGLNLGLQDMISKHSIPSVQVCEHLALELRDLPALVSKCTYLVTTALFLFGLFFETWSLYIVPAILELTI